VSGAKTPEYRSKFVIKVAIFYNQRLNTKKIALKRFYSDLPLFWAFAKGMTHRSVASAKTAKPDFIVHSPNVTGHR